MDHHALWRGAKYFRSANFADYIAFLNENIPLDAQVILPPEGEIPKSATYVPTMQFFLSSRDIKGCENNYNQCIEINSQLDKYILILGRKSNTLKELNISPDRVVLHSQILGLIKPDQESAKSTSPLISFPNRFEIILLLIPPILFLFVIAKIGSLIIGYFYPNDNWIIEISLGYLLGVGVFSLSLYCIMLFGVVMSSTLIWVNLTLFFFVGMYFGWLNKRNDRGDLRFTLNNGKSVKSFVKGLKNIFWNNKISDGESSTRIDIWHILILLYAIIIVFVSLGRGYSYADDIFVWGAKGKGIVADGLVEGVSNWGTQTTRYTLNTPIWLAVFNVWFNEAVPQSKLLFSILSILLYFTIYEKLKEKIPRNIAGSFTLLFSTVPLIYRHSTLAFANLFVSAYFIAAVLVTIKAGEMDDENQQFKLFGLASLLFALAGWTRPETTIINILVIALISCVLLFRLQAHKKWKMIIIFVLPYFIYFCFWTITSSHIYNDHLLSDGLYRKVLGDLVAGNFRFDALKVIFTELVNKSFDLNSWGLWGVFLIISILHSTLKIREINSSNILMYGVGVLYVLCIMGMYYSTGFYEVPSINWWVETGLYRMIMPGYLLLGIAGITSIFAENEE